MWLVAGLAGLVALGATGWEAFRTWRLVRHAGFDQVRAGVGVGLYMAFAGALLGLAAASRARRQLRAMRLLRIRQAVPAPPGPSAPSEHAAPPTP